MKNKNKKEGIEKVDGNVGSSVTAEICIKCNIKDVERAREREREREARVGRCRHCVATPLACAFQSSIDRRSRVLYMCICVPHASASTQGN